MMAFINHFIIQDCVKNRMAQTFKLATTLVTNETVTTISKLTKTAHPGTLLQVIETHC